MGWTEHYRRRDAIDLVLTRRAGITLAEPAVRAVFADRAELALALQYKWSQILTGHLAAALDDADIDHVEAVARAWRAAAERQPALRALLDDYAADPDAGPEFRAARRAEASRVAFAAGLAEPGEPAEESARVGAAFLELVRTAPGRAHGRTPVERMFRRLAASA